MPHSWPISAIHWFIIPRRSTDLNWGEESSSPAPIFTVPSPRGKIHPYPGSVSDSPAAFVDRISTQDSM